MISKRCYTLVFCLYFIITPLVAQDAIKELPTGYYMTVAAYLSSGEDYAIRYTNKLVAQGYSAEYGFTYKKNMYFVYIKRYDDFKVAIGEINSTRKNTIFDDTWVYVYQAINPVREAPVSAPPIAVVTSTPAPINEDTLILFKPADTVAIVEEITVPEEVIPEGSRIVYLETVHARTHQPVEIEFTLYDPANERVLGTMKSREPQRILPPISNNPTVHVTTNSFGWVKDEINFDFNNPVTDTTNHFARLVSDTLVLFFEMHRMHTGDIQALYNVYFFNESAIMLRHSHFQLEELLAMLEENKTYRIKLHGHTNGSASGSYSRLAEGDTIFFNMSPKHEQTSGSAKDLSFDRANTVRQYLVKHGVTEDRIEIKGWGGKKMIHDENSKAAKRNIRVEVEVLADQ